MRSCILICALGLGACSVPHVVWEQPEQNAAIAEAQRKIDTAGCEEIAMRTVSLPSGSATPTGSATQPEPPAQTEPAARTESAVAFRNLDQSAIVNSGQVVVPGSEAEAKLIRAAALKEVDTERRAVSDACMWERGWTERSAPAVKS